jgi:hypothetical protein
MDVQTTPPLKLRDWLSIVEREYLAEFLPAGGGVVKFAILEEDGAAAAAERLARLAEQHGMLAVAIDAAVTRIHLMHELFFAVARAMPWDRLVQRYVEGLLAANGYAWPRPGQAMAIPELAAAFAVAPALLTQRIDQWLTADLWEDRRLAQDFRAALLQLCLTRLDGRSWEAAGPAAQWLAGEKVPQALLRTADISVRLSRTNARAMLTSLCHFLRKTETPGLVVTLDCRRLAYGSAVMGLLRYSPAAVMDAYEVLREIIDDAEHLPGLFVAVLADATLATGDPRRALEQYAALQMRVWPDVRPGDRQNPLAPLVWLAA